MNAAIVLASGSGIRLGGDIPKQFLLLGGKPVFLHSLETFDRHPQIGRLALVCHPDWIDTVRRQLAGLKRPWEIVPGGASRMESSWNGLRALGVGPGGPVGPDGPAGCGSPGGSGGPGGDRGDSGIVLIHDAARPFVRPETISALIEAAERHGAAVPAIPTADTLIEVEDGFIRSIPDRERLRRVQTPQAFRVEVIREAFERARAEGFTTTTDDSRLVLRLGRPVACVEGAESNFKITSREDLAWAQQALEARGSPGGIAPGVP